MDAFVKLVETFVRGVDQTPEGQNAQLEFNNAYVREVEEKLANRFRNECCHGEKNALFNAVTNATSYATADANKFYAQYHASHGTAVACALCAQALSAKAGKPPPAHKKAIFMVLDQSDAGFYLCEGCGRFLQIVHTAFHFGEFFRNMLVATTTADSSPAGPIFGALKNETTLKMPVRRWKLAADEYEGAPPFVKGVITYRTTLESLLKAVDYTPAAKRRKVQEDEEEE
jgi:hypothetical protein